MLATFALSAATLASVASASTQSTEVTQAAEVAQASPAAEGEPDALQAAEGEQETSQAAEGEQETSQAAEGEPETSPAAEGEPEASPAAEGEPEASQAADGEPETSQGAEGEPEAAQATEEPSERAEPAEEPASTASSTAAPEADETAAPVAASPTEILTPAQIAERWNAGEISDQEAFELAQVAASQPVAPIDETAPIIEAIPEPSEESRRLYREGRAFLYGLNGRFVDRKRGLELLEKAAEAGSLNAMAETALAYWGNGASVALRWKEAYELAGVPARLGHPFAQLTLAKYFEEEGPNWNLDKSKEYYAKAAAGLKRWAEAGDPMAASLLAGLYADGKGVEKNAEEAERWHKRAVEKECAIATRNYGDFLSSIDRAQEAVATLRRAAVLNEPLAWRDIGGRYILVEKNNDAAIACCQRAFELDDGLSEVFVDLADAWFRQNRDAQEAILWLEKAAESGNDYAFAKLAEACLRLNNGVQNFAKIEEYCNKAIERGDANGWLALGMRYQADDRPEFKDKAYECYRKAAESVSGEAAISWAYEGIGDCYAHGIDVKKNPQKAFEYYGKSAQYERASAMVRLGVCYENGIGVERNSETAVEWYRKAAEAGNADAMFNLGVCYKDGTGVEQNAETAVEWYRKAAELGDTLAMNDLGVCYTTGTGVEQNAETAVEWYRKAADEGDADAMVNLGLCYQYGRGVERNAET
ncbi:MAG: SEL1-like repeat protein, partial [Thermoguttaceae bacterium]|nr:SEL1-like repeat protein [Thermoguttaceae bacterium]